MICSLSRVRSFNEIGIKRALLCRTAILRNTRVHRRTYSLSKIQFRSSQFASAKVIYHIIFRLAQKREQKLVYTEN